MTRERTIRWEDPAPTARLARSASGEELLRQMLEGKLPHPPIMDTLDYALDEIEAGRTVFSLVPQEFHYNPIGVVHGGVAATLLADSGGLKLFSLAGFYQADDERLARAPGRLSGVIGAAPEPFDV